MKNFSYSLSFLLIVFFSQTAQNQTIESLLPVNGSTGDWLPVGVAEKYASEELFYLINGGADLYLEYGFIRVIAQTYENNAGHKIQLEIYEMDRDSAAFGIFTAQKTRTGIYTDLGDLSLKTTHSLAVWKSSYFILLRSSQSDSLVQNGFCQLAEKVVNKIPHKGKIPDWIKPLGIELYEITYIKGPIGLQNIYYFGTALPFQEFDAIAVMSDSVKQVFIRFPETVKGEDVFQKWQQTLLQIPKFSFIKKDETRLVISDNRQQVLTFELHSNLLILKILNK